MPAILNPKLTDAGKAAAVNANANGLQLGITHIALGSGKYNSATSGAGMTALVGRKEQVLIGAGLVTGAGGFRINVRFTAWEGTPNPYDASEIGFYAGDPATTGILFAVYSHPSDVIVQRNSLDYVASFNLQITDVPPGSITVVVDPDASQALALLSLHENATNPHTGYVRKVGDTSTGPQIGVTAPQHDNGKAFATTEYVKRLGLNFPTAGALAINGNITLVPANIGSWADIRANGAAVVLPLSSDCQVGASMIFRVSSLSAVLTTQGGDVIASPIVGSGASLQVIQGETITVTRNAPGVWEVIGTGFRMTAGSVSYFAGNAAPPGWLKLNGATLSRAAYPALWLYAQSQGVVSDADWINSGFSGRFSSGTTGSDFRIPDARGTFLRALDDGRGLDAGRAWGTFQDHANRNHNHTVSDPGHNHGVYDPGHSHGAFTDVQGVHGHPSIPGVRGFAYTGDAGIGNNGTAQGLPQFGAGFGSSWSTTDYTGAAGAHGHNITVNPSLSSIGIYGNGTGIQIQADGSESRPRNLAWALCVKF
jgi:hypothetical protein